MWRLAAGVVFGVVGAQWGLHVAALIAIALWIGWQLLAYCIGRWVILWFLVYYYQCQQITWRGHNVVIMNAKARKALVKDELAFYTSYGLGWFCFVSHSAFRDREVREHEWTHRQQHYQDLLFSIKYEVYQRIKGYLDNPYEIEARETAALMVATHKRRIKKKANRSK